VYFWLVCLVLVQGLVLGVTNAGQYVETVFVSLTPSHWRAGQAVFVAGSIVYALFLVKNLVRAAGQEAEVRAQAAQMANFGELLRAMRAQRHDFVNHVQALYGLIKAGSVAEALRYIEAVYGEVKQTSQVLQLGEPEMIALLHAKMGEAEAKGVRFTLRVDPQFRGVLALKDLNRLIGNLVDNAVEAAEACGAGDRWVEVDLLAERGSYEIRVANAGEINEAVRRQIFEAGFSTKPAGKHEGMGLYVVRSLAERHGGRVAVESARGRTVFTVSLPGGARQAGGKGLGKRA
ncbi:MAG: Spo0B domain-containing protein, partial [Clostridia bacterium]|nr:Spo0B domain-containing protein [Clostridia bacterium]